MLLKSSPWAIAIATLLLSGCLAERASHEALSGMVADAAVSPGVADTLPGDGVPDAGEAVDALHDMEDESADAIIDAVEDDDTIAPQDAEFDGGTLDADASSADTPDALDEAGTTDAQEVEVLVVADTALDVEDASKPDAGNQDIDTTADAGPTVTGYKAIGGLAAIPSPVGGGYQVREASLSNRRSCASGYCAVGGIR